MPDREKYRHGRRSIRLKDYDYSEQGAYFVTICAKNRECLFGEIVNGQIFRNDLGLMIEQWWSKLSRKFPLIETDAHVVMPNHFHGIIMIVGADPCVCPNLGAHIGARRTENCAMVQDGHYKRIPAPPETTGCEHASSKIVAAQLLRTYHPK